ncbi:hypothetical protein QBC35DRAFT_492545 [Podospora australis]|uniref:Uncharacterized protein n=1 Tax=Podospora australis TaxID=1536484 RepID=A0AAN6WWD2_9PEZI|nr:hypothetical protein QBC35DRAFT_492545 [Podospora australis]
MFLETQPNLFGRPAATHGRVEREVRYLCMRGPTIGPLRKKAGSGQRPIAHLSIAPRRGLHDVSDWIALTASLFMIFFFFTENKTLPSGEIGPARTARLVSICFPLLGLRHCTRSSLPLKRRPLCSHDACMFSMRAVGCRLHQGGPFRHVDIHNACSCPVLSCPVLVGYFPSFGSLEVLFHNWWLPFSVSPASQRTTTSIRRWWISINRGSSST